MNNIDEGHMFAGDFNCLLNATDKTRGRQVHANQLVKLQTLVEDCALLPIDDNASSFSWTNKRIGASGAFPKR